jgi:hypothetical protein
MFGLFGKSRDGLTKAQSNANEVRDKRYREAVNILGDAIRTNDASMMAHGVNLMNRLIQDYPDFPKPFVKMIQFSLKAKQFDLAKQIYDEVRVRFPDDPEVKTESLFWDDILKKNSQAG